MRKKGAIFSLLVVCCVVVTGGYVAWAVARAHAGSGPPPKAVATAKAHLADAAAGGTPLVLFEHVARDDNYARVAVTRLEDRQARMHTSLVCERVYFAGGRGLCLVPRAGLTQRFDAKIFDARFNVRDTVTLAGINSRARVSADGHYGAVTAFIAGHSYANSGQFSTRTTLIDLRSGDALAHLEQFDVVRNGKRFDSQDFNFWGVTFARDSNRFYATLGTRGKTYLVRGDVRRRHAVVLHENVECPSLSPDGLRVAYKKRVGTQGWRLHVLDLATGAELALAETRSFDDQVEWLDNEHVIYGLGSDVWIVRTNGAGPPRRFLADALSPAVVAPAPTNLVTRGSKTTGTSS
jgi:hypothetical protein